MNIVLWWGKGNIVDGGGGGSSRNFLNLEKEMQMHTGRGTRDPPDSLPPHELTPRSSPSSRTGCAMLQHPSSSPSVPRKAFIQVSVARAPDQCPYLLFVLNVRTLPPAGSPPELAMPPFPVPTFYHLSILDLSAGLI